MSFGMIPLSPDDKPDGFVLLSTYEKLESENTNLRELALGLKWCSENYGCKDVCPLYDKSEPEHCREERLLRELGVEVDE